MSREVHVRFREHLRGRFPRVTRLVFTFEYRHEAKRFYSALPNTSSSLPDR